MDGSEERSCVFGVSCSDVTPAFELKESILNQMAHFIKIFVVRPLFGTIFLWRDHCFHVLILGPFEDDIGIAGPDLPTNNRPPNQLANLSAISFGALCDNNPERHTMRIHDQIYIGVEPLLCGPCPDCRLWFRQHEDEPCNELHQSSAIHNPAHQSEFPAIFPICLCRANG